MKKAKICNNQLKASGQRKKWFWLGRFIGTQTLNQSIYGERPANA